MEKSIAGLVSNSTLGAEGTEAAADSIEKPHVYHPSGAISGAAGQNNLAEFAELISLWPQLSAPSRNALLQLARSAQRSAT